ncbi:hypothetical protein N7494_001944 [Penicillium frequentans]|uniref:Uncharacterized protein n=1 Tax=Penicillium frequentans TaxID=3151616 RepID=A0AAD6GJQ4_9EURO|nr:hypothetical protein N7494_001944 [Penicillium glabrum]
MRKFYYGTTFGIDAEKLRYTEISTLPLERNESFWSTPTPSLTTKIRQDFMTSLISVAAKVCPAAPGPTLCLRIQEIAQASRENKGRIFPLAAQETTTMEYSSGADDHPVQCRTCRICGIIWKLELRVPQYEKDIFLVSTRWLDLGPGLSPEDWQWEIHHHYLELDVLEDLELLVARSRSETESIQTSPSEEDLFHRNSAFLEQQTYRGMMTRWGASKWYLAGEDREESKSGYYDIM